MGNRAVAAKRPTGRRVRCVAMLLAAMLAWTVPAAAGAPELVAQGERALRRVVQEPAWCYQENILSSSIDVHLRPDSPSTVTR